MKVSHIRNYIERHRLIGPGDRILVAHSGGPDSTYLLIALRKLYQDVSAVYVNHQLRGNESVQEEAFVREFCEKRKIPLYVERLKWNGVRSNLEERARKKRYACFAKVAAEHHFQKVALAQHLDDQIETFLLRLFRGSGPAGLASMRPKRGIYVRPLLKLHKREILEALARERIPFVSDNSNSDLRFTRNRVRNEMIPYLEEHLNPAVKKAIGRSISWIQEQDKLASSFLRPYFRIIHGRPGRIKIPIPEFLKLRPIVQKAVLRETIRRSNPAQIPSARTLSKLRKAISLRKEMELPGFLMLQFAEENLLITTKKHGMGEFEMYIPGEGRYRFPPASCTLRFSIQKDVQHGYDSNIAYLDAEKASFPLVVRNWKKGDRFHPLGMKGSKKLSDYWIDKKIPKSDRRKIPLLFKEEELAWIGGFQIDHHFRVTDQTRKVLKVEKLVGRM